MSAEPIKRIMPQPLNLQGRFTFVADGLATEHNCDFIIDPRFQRAYEKGMDTIRDRRPELHVEWRVYTACWAASHGAQLEGDFVECGVYTGIYSRAIMEYLDFNSMPDRQFWLLDTFEGIPEEKLTDSERQAGRMRSNAKYTNYYEGVIETFKPFENAHIVKGAVPDTLDEVKSDKVCYLSIDMNTVIPEIAAANYFWDKLSSGAIMLLDDYGFAAHFEQKVAFDKFAQEKNVPLLPLPTGQAMIIKP